TFKKKLLTHSLREKKEIMKKHNRYLMIEQERININTLICDPIKHPPIWYCPINQQDEIPKVYLKFGAYQILMDVYPLFACWFRIFPWLEYSLEENIAFFHVIHFLKNQFSFILKGFRNWKKVTNRKECIFISYEKES
ncbi:hypothetical protein CR513_10607, partial [Mucuna pruriens]